MLNHSRDKETKRLRKLRELIESDIEKDLHLHTYFSDGRMSPAAVVEMRIAEGYKLISITDHDGIEGSIEGFEYIKKEKKDVKFISGIEFDSEDELGKDLHMLGYGFDYDNPELREVLHDILIKRARRNDVFMNALNDRGFGVTVDDVGMVNGGRYVGKPTFALILQRKGIIKDMDDAFNNLFREPDLKAVKKETLATRDVVDVIHTAGGLAVLAHPMEQRRHEESFADFKPRLFRILDRMVEYGIDGIECYHPSASEEQAEMLCSYAKERGLMITKGSDFHAVDHNRDFSRYHKP